MKCYPTSTVIRLFLLQATHCYIQYLATGCSDCFLTRNIFQLEICCCNQFFFQFCPPFLMTLYKRVFRSTVLQKFYEELETTMLRMIIDKVSHCFTEQCQSNFINVSIANLELLRVGPYKKKEFFRSRRLKNQNY